MLVDAAKVPHSGRVPNRIRPARDVVAENGEPNVVIEMIVGSINRAFITPTAQLLDQAAGMAEGATSARAHHHQNAPPGWRSHLALDAALSSSRPGARGRSRIAARQSAGLISRSRVKMLT